MSRMQVTTVPARRTRWLLLAVAAGLAGCGGKAAPPGPGTSQGAVPDLRGTRVMLFPVQSRQGLVDGSDAEIAFALTQRGPDVDWVLPAEMAGALERSPAMDARIHGLPVGMFLQGEVRRVGDPLYGYLRRVGALVDSDVALVPVVARYRPESAERRSGVEIGAAVLSVRTGYVLWFGMVEGAPGAADDPGALASAADALGRRLLPFSVTRGPPQADAGADRMTAPRVTREPPQADAGADRKAARAVPRDPGGAAERVRVDGDALNERARDTRDVDEMAIAPPGRGAGRPRL